MSSGNSSESQNVVVAARVRPLDATEAKIGARSVVRCQDNKTIIVDPTYLPNEKTFTFDYSFWSGEPLSDCEYTSQADVFNKIGRSMLMHAFEGFNVCIFSYGQTNAGKTYTMMGAEDDPGIIPRFCEELFLKVAEFMSVSAEVSFKVELSYYEIYNERVRCLLTDEGSHKRELRVREHPITGPFVEDLSTYIIDDYEDVFKWLTIGNQSRTVACTKYNQTSSRSHAVFTLTLTQNKMDDEGQCTEVVSKINLVDLAGSERCGQTSSASTNVFKEGVTINKSLSTLGRVIHALSEQGEVDAQEEPGEGPVKKRRHFVGYRDSVLTWLLKENLGGNSKTIMLANISPASTNYEESLNTLRYADRVKYIKNEAVVNEDHNAKLIRELKQEINFLRGRLCVEQDPVTESRRSSCSAGSSFAREVSIDEGDSPQDWRAKLEMSDQIIAEINQSWQDRLNHSQKVYHEKLGALEHQLIAKTNTYSYAIEDLPLIININPHPVPGEQLAHVLRPGETYLGTDDETITEETKDDIRLQDGFNLSNPHCIFEHHETGEVEMIPLNGSLSYVNGQLLTTTFILTHGCRIVLGSNHIFLFVDPIHAKAFREHKKAQGGGIPRIIDWTFVSKEFADSMHLLCKPHQLQALREDIDALTEENSTLKEDREAVALDFENYRLAPFLVLITDADKLTAEASSRRLCYHLKAGRSLIGVGGDISPKGCSGQVLLEFDPRSGHVYTITGHNTHSSPLRNGQHILTGACAFQLVLPATDGSKAIHADDYRSGGAADRLGPSLGVPSASPKKPEPSPKKTLTKGADHASRAAAKHTPTAAAAAAVTATSNGDVPPPTPVDANFVDDLKQKLYDFQFAILNMRDQLFPPPPEAPENAEGEPPAPDPMLTPEELELQEKRRVLKDDWLLTSKKCVGSDILDHMMYLQHELRYLTFVSAQREQLVDQLQYAVEHGQREESDAEIARLQSELAHMQSAATSMRQQLELQAGHVPDGHADLDGPFPTDTSSIPSIDSPRSMTQPPAVPPLLPGTEDQRKDTVIKELQDQVSRLEAKLAASQDAAVVAHAEDAASGPISHRAAEVEETKRRMKEVQAKLEHITAAHDALVGSYNELLRKQNQIDDDSKAHGAASQGDSAALREELQLMARKLQGAELRAAQIQQKLEGRTQDYDTLYYTHQKLKEDMDLQRQQLHEATTRQRSDLDDPRTTKKKAEQDLMIHHSVQQASLVANAVSLPKDSIKAFNKMKDTIKLLTKVAKSKDDKIAKLEKEIHSKSELLSTINSRLSDREHRAGGLLPPPASYGADGGISPATLEYIQGMREGMDCAMQQLKAEVIHLSRSSLSALDKIVSSVTRSGGAEMYKKAHAFVRKMVGEMVGEVRLGEEVWRIGDRDIEKIKAHHRAPLVKALQEMVICYDNVTDFIKGGLITHDDIVRNAPSLVKMARFCMVHEKSRMDVSPSRSKNPSPSQDRHGDRHHRGEETVEKHKRSSSASSNRSSTATVHTTNSSHKSAYGATTSRLASYISPKRQGPSPAAALPSQGPSVTRHSSPRPGAFVAYPSTTNSSSLLSTRKSRALSPRPGTTTPTTTTVSSFSRPKSKSPSPSPALRATSPFSTHSVDKVSALSRSNTPRTAATRKAVLGTAGGAGSLGPARSLADDDLCPDSPGAEYHMHHGHRPPMAPQRAATSIGSPTTPPTTPKYNALSKTYDIPPSVSDLRQQQTRTKSPLH